MKKYNRKTFQNCDAKPTIETVTNKRHWCVVNNKGKLMYHEDGFLLIFPRRKDALDWVSNNTNPGLDGSRIEKLDITIVRQWKL